MKTYTTIQGDTFDIIAKKVYKDELKIEKLIECNIEYANTVIFSADTEITVPDVPEKKVKTNTLPPWRRT